MVDMSQPLTSNGDPATTFHDQMQQAPRPDLSRRILNLPLDLFSSVRLGIVLLALLFVYSSVGSAGVPVKINIFDPAAWVAPRQWRGLEMTEFEWFHWWPFKLIIGLICANIITTTLRRIPLNFINL